MFYRPYPISRSKIILSNPHPLVITGSRIKLIGHFSFCNKFAIYACHESVCIFPKRECHLREKDHHRDHSCNYIPALTTIKDWHTKAYCHSPSKCLLLNMNSNYLNPIENNKQWCFVLSMIKVYVVVEFYPWFNIVYRNLKMRVKQRERQIETRIKLNHNKYIVYQLKLNLTCFYSAYFFLASSCSTATSAWFCCCYCIMVICIWLSC